jgi:hypothetical protein
VAAPDAPQPAAADDVDDVAWVPLDKLPTWPSESPQSHLPDHTHYSMHQNRGSCKVHAVAGSAVLVDSLCECRMPGAHDLLGAAVTIPQAQRYGVTDGAIIVSHVQLMCLGLLCCLRPALSC